MENYFFPPVSIITVNYNGARFLTGLFHSIKNLKYPFQKIETIMVDNNSGDDSCKLVSDEFPWVKIIRLKKNHGYAGGNNEGLKNASSDLIALINNDCVLEKEWLAKLTGLWQEKSANEKIGAIGSRVLFYHQYLVLSFSSGENKTTISDLHIEASPDPLPETTGKILPEEKNLLSSYIRFLKNCSQVKKEDDGTGKYWKIENSSLIAIPIESLEKSTTLSLKASSEHDQDLDIYLITGSSSRKAESVKTSQDPTIITLRFGPQDYIFRENIINSCGLEVNKSFYARDRGSHCRDDGSIFLTDEEIFCPSGSSLLLDKKLIREVGLFDPRFFTYYEDLDLFWRARLKGWKIYFCAGSIARHHHCGTGVEWSPSFTYFVLRNRLLAIFRCAWVSLAARSCFSFAASTLILASGFIKSRFKGKKMDRPDLPLRVKILLQFFYLLPWYCLSRIRTRFSSKIRDMEIKKWITSF